MTDTTQEIKKIQLKIWLDKSPMERLRQLMIDNEAIFKFWNEVKPSEKVDLDNSEKSIEKQVTKKNQK